MVMVTGMVIYCYKLSLHELHRSPTPLATSTCSVAPAPPCRPLAPGACLDVWRGEPLLVQSIATERVLRFGIRYLLKNKIDRTVTV